MTLPAVPGDPAFAHQSTFRAAMEAMARPGRIYELSALPPSPAPLSPAAAALAAALFDFETPIWLDASLAAAPEVVAWLRFATGAPIVADPVRADFALIADPRALPPFEAFAPGTPEYPDRSATLILQVGSLTAGTPLVLAGPGIKQTHMIAPAPIPDDFTTRLATNRALFPRGVDLVLATSNAVAALPRSVRILEA